MRKKALFAALLTGLLASTFANSARPAAPHRMGRPASVAAKARRPNIVLILADDLGYGDIGPYGQRKIETPNLDALAKAGVRFTQFYAGDTVCAPSRGALISGRDSGRGLIRGNKPLGGNFTDDGETGQLPLKAGTPTLPGMLHGIGYRTVGIGKWGLGGPGGEGQPTRQGFDRFFGYLDQRQAHNYYPTHLWDNTRRVPLANRFFIPHPKMNGTSDKPEDYHLYQGTDYSPERMLAEAESTIASSARSGTPLFLYYAPTLPHASLQVPDALVDHYRKRFPEMPTNGEGYTPHPTPRAARAAMITRLDFEVGRIRTAIEKAGIAKNTLIIFCSDNGPSSEGGADIDFFGSSGGLRGQKRDMYEGGLRSPFIAYWPTRYEGGKTVTTIAAAWDLLPTFADITGAPIAGQTDGHSFRRALEGRAMAATGPLYWEYNEVGKSGQAVRDGEWKAIRFQPHGFDPGQPIELYDLTADPHEDRNIAADHAEVVAHLKRRLDARQPSPIKGFNFDPDPSGGS
jgi:arylsulfatase A-like enzyme